MKRATVKIVPKLLNFEQKQSRIATKNCISEVFRDLEKMLA